MSPTKKQILTALSLAAILGATKEASAANFTTTSQQAGGQNWNAAIWQGTSPTAGNTYECIAGGNPTRVRNPTSGLVETFAGDSLQLDTSSEIRAKVSVTALNFPGVGGNAGLIMNGGNIDTGDDAVFTLSGVVLVQSASSITCGDAAQSPRGWIITAQIRGSAPWQITKQVNNSTVPAADIRSVDNPYTGTWNVKSGFLKATGSGSLGNANVTISATNAALAPAQLEVMYDVNSTGTLILSNGGRMVLHQTCGFSSVIINGTPLAVGTYTFADLSANYPANFVAGGSGSISVVPPAPPFAPLNISAVNGDTQVILSWNAALNAAGYFINRSSTSGGPYTTIGSSGTAGFTDTGLVNGTTNYYVIVATNSLGASTNSSEVVGIPNVVVVGITAVGGTNQVTLNWTALATAASYSVLRASSAGGPFTVVASGLAGTTYVDPTVQSGRTYFYRVSAPLNDGGQSGQSATVSATTSPGAPTLTATLFASTVIRVGWTKDPVVTQFSLERSIDGVNFAPLTTLGGTVTSYTNTALSPSTTYSYRVQASNATGPSDYSNIASNTTPVSGFNVNFGSAPDASTGARNSPTPPGYLNDTGAVYAVRESGISYGWTTLGGTNIGVDTRWRANAISPDLRYDTFVHLMKANVNNPAQAAFWEIEVPNGFYTVHIVGGDADNADANADHFQFEVEGTSTSVYIPSATPTTAHWADFVTSAAVSDGRLTIKCGSLALNNKIAFVDIYPDIPVAPVLATQPQSQTIEQNRPVTFSVTLSAGSTPLSYQWYLGNNPVMSAPSNNRTLTIPHVQLSDAGDYSVIVTNYGGSATSMVATLTVLADTNPPVVASVASLDGYTIGLCFSEEMDNSNLSLNDSFSYTVNGNNPDFAVVRPDGRSVILILNAPISGPFTVDAALSGPMLDLAENMMVPAGSHAAGVVGGFTGGDIGAPLPMFPGSHFTCDSNVIEIVGGGGDYWANSDQAYLLTEPVTGDFEARVRVVGLTGSNTITKAILAARESRNPDSRGYHLSLNPPPPGRDLMEMGMRDVAAGGTVGVGNTFTPAGVPNAWLRLTRIGNTFTGYRSTNGVNWVALGTNTTGTPYPATMAVGLSVTAHDNTLLATGTFSNLQISGLVGPQFLTETYSAGTFTATFPTRNGFTYVVEYKNTVTTPAWTTLGSPIVGDGTVKSFTDPGPVSPSDHRIYRVSFR